VDEIEQLFGQSPNYYTKNHFSLFWLLPIILTGLLILVLLLMAAGYVVKFSGNDGTDLNQSSLSIAPAKLDQTNVHFPEETGLPAAQAKATEKAKKVEKKPRVAEKKNLSAPPIKEIIYKALMEEFGNDLSRWSAEINPLSLTVSFKVTEAFFKAGQASLASSYQSLLADFFPRYLKVLKRFATSIEAVNIEGHASSEWSRHTSPDTAYLNNMALSQRRTRAVLEYCFSLPTVTPHKAWLRKSMLASGWSSSHPIITKNGIEEPNFSRRVDFKIVIQ